MTAPTPAAVAPAAVSSTVAAPHRRGFSKNVPIAACKLRAQDLKRLYQIINDKQLELGVRMVDLLRLMADETNEQFEQRRIRVRDAYVTAVIINGANGDVVTGHAGDIFDEPIMPDRIVSITYDTTFSPRTNINYVPTDVASVYLDFSRPPLLNLGGYPSTPTPNNSYWNVAAPNESWPTALSAQLQQFFEERATNVNWLHGPSTYDALLMIIGWPLSLWGAYKIGHLIVGGRELSPAVGTAVYVYGFFLSANIFRALFSYSRWIFPKIELESANSPPLKHRALWYTIIIGVIGASAWDGIKAIL
jgi:hypothetical protein